MHNTKIRFRIRSKSITNHVWRENETYTNNIRRSMSLLSDHPIPPPWHNAIKYTNTFTKFFAFRKREFSYSGVVCNSDISWTLEHVYASCIHIGTAPIVYSYIACSIIQKISLWCDTVESHNKYVEEDEENAKENLLCIIVAMALAMAAVYFKHNSNPKDMNRYNFSSFFL